MDIFKLLTPLIYWLLIGIWLAILILYFKHIREWAHDSLAMKVLVAVLALDALRSLFESAYFGIWFTSLVGLLPESIHSTLIRPELVFIPKLVNLLVASVILFVLIRRWVPKLISERESQIRSIDRLQMEIAERRQVESDLQQQHQKHLSLLESINGIGWELNLSDQRFTYVSPNAQRISGYPVEAWIDMASWTGMILPEDREFVLKHFEAETTAGNDHTFEYRMRKPDGEVIWVLNAVTVYQDAEGRPSRATGLIMDNSHQHGLLERLTQSQKDYREAQETAHIGHWQLDIASGKAAWSEEIHRIVGSERNQEVGPAFLQKIVDPRDLAALQSSMTSAIEQGTTHEMEYRIRRPDGKERWLFCKAQRQLDEDGKPAKLVGIAQDITDRKRAEISLRKNERFLQNVFDAIQDGISVLDTDYNILRTNRWIEQRHADQLPLSGKKCYQAFGHCDSPCAWCPTSRTLETGEAQSESVSVPSPDGAKKWIELSTFPVKDETGRVAGVIEYVKDVTDRKAAELGLVESENRFRAFFEKNSCVMLLIEPDSGKVVDANTAAADFYGYSRQRLVGMPISDINTLPPEVIAQERQAAAQEERNYFNFQHRLADGSLRSVEVYSTPIKSGENKLLFSIVHDVTARKQAEEQLQLAASVFTHASEGITITDASGRILDVNAAFSHITGYARDEVIGRNPSMLQSGRHGKSYYAGMWQDLAENGHWFGEIWNRRKNGEVYAEMLNINAVKDAEGQVQNYVALFSDITSQKEHQRQLEHIAHYDVLTNLPNRILLADRLQQVMAQVNRRNDRLAVAYLDLDGFKAINDDHGHDVGDKLLVILADRLKHALREGDTISRLGGDEFVAVLVDLSDETDCIPLLERLLTAASEPLYIDGQGVKLSASLGVTFYPQIEEIDADQLLRQADQAMYQAKLAGKNCFHLFDTDQDRTVRGQREILERIRLALADEEFVLHYQPKVNMRTGEVFGAEALIRWRHPDKGLLPPAAFLPAIEADQLSVAVGEWVIENALSQLDRWHRAGLELAVSVNIGALHLQQPDFIEHLRHRLQAYPDIDNHYLELEVLETSALEDIARVSGIMHSLQQIGVQFSLDDFGTGYSSLTYLKRLPAAILKIDGSFVRDMLDDPDDLAILDGVLGLASAFRRKTIAEGVETLEHGELLLQLGCELAQGYGIAKPMAADELPAWIAAWRPHPSWAKMQPIAREDLPLLFAITEHRAWVKMLEGCMTKDRGEPGAITPVECHFGQWLAGDGKARFGSKANFRRIVSLHEQVHDLGNELCDLKRQGQAGQAVQRLDEVRDLRDDLLDQLHSLLDGGRQ